MVSMARMLHPDRQPSSRAVRVSASVVVTGVLTGVLPCVPGRALSSAHPVANTTTRIAATTATTIRTLSIVGTGEQSRASARAAPLRRHAAAFWDFDSETD